MNRLWKITCFATMAAAMGSPWIAVLATTVPEQASVTVILDWAPGVSPAHVPVMLCPEGNGGTPRSEIALLSAAGDAKVVFAAVGPGTYRIASPEGSPYAFGGLARVTPQTLDVSVTVRVQKASLVTVPFRVLLSHDERPVEARVTYWRQEWNKAEAPTSEQGEGTFSLRRGAQYWVRAAPVKSILAKPAVVGPLNSSEYDGKTLDIRLPSEPPVFVCRWDVGPGDSQQVQQDVKVTVFMENAAGRRTVACMGLYSPNFWQKMLTNPALRVFERFEAVPDGQYRMEAEARMGNQLWLADANAVDVSVRNGRAEPREFQFTLSRDVPAKLHVTVTDAQNAPPQGAKVYLGVHGGIQQEVSTDARGAATLEPVCPGEYELAVGAPNSVTSRRIVCLKPGVNELTVALAAPILLRGQVLDSSGAACASEGRIISLSDSKLVARFGNADGRFSCSVPGDVFPLLLRAVVAPGNAEVSMVLDRAPSSPVVLRVPPGAMHQLRVEFPSIWASQHAGAVYLWLCPGGSVVPAAVVPLRTKPDSPSVDDKARGIRLEQRLLTPGRYSLWVQFGSDFGAFAHVGEQLVEEATEVQISLDGTYATKPLAAIYREIKLPEIPRTRTK